MGGTVVVLGLLLGAASGGAAPTPQPTLTVTPKPPPIAANMMVLPLNLPRIPLTIGPHFLPARTNADPKSLAIHRGPFLVPKDTKLISLGKPVTSSDARPIIGTLSMVTDGQKKAEDGYWIDLAPGKQWVQIDLGRSYHIYAIVVWHYYGEPRIYRDVVVQVADDPPFTARVHTLFDNSVVAGPPAHKGKDRDYYETNKGKLIPGNGVKARYVRLYSNGNSSDAQNHFTEVEVWGK